MDDTRVRHQSSESSWAVLSCGTDYSTMQGRCRWKHAVQDGSNVLFLWTLNNENETDNFVWTISLPRDLLTVLASGDGVTSMALRFAAAL